MVTAVVVIYVVTAVVFIIVVVSLAQALLL